MATARFLFAVLSLGGISNGKRYISSQSETCHIFNPLTTECLSCFPLYMNLWCMYVHMYDRCICTCVYACGGWQSTSSIIFYCALPYIFKCFKILYVCVYVQIQVHMCMCVHRNILRSEEGWSTSWSWSYRWLCKLLNVGAGIPTLVFWALSGLNFWAISPVLRS